jgi:hypothetical protein
MGNTGTWLHERIQIGTDSAGQFVHGGLGSIAHGAWGPAGVGMICTGEDDLDATPTDLYFALYADGGWSEQQRVAQVGNTGVTGGSIAADSQVGFGIAWVDLRTNILSYITSADGKTWSNAEQVYGMGSGGWEPSLAFDPNHNATVAYFVCSLEPGVTDNCPPTEQGLWVAIQRAAHVWDPQLVDSSGGRQPVLLYNGGQIILIYRDPSTGGLKIARQLAP